MAAGGDVDGAFFGSGAMFQISCRATITIGLRAEGRVDAPA